MGLPTYALRLFARRPAFSTAIVLTLTLGIGANTAIFSLARAVVMRPLPYHDPERLVFVWSHRAGTPIVHEQHGILTGTHVLEWQRRASSLESLAVISSSSNNPTDALDLVSSDGAERLRGAFVTPNFFQLLGVNALAGRTFESSDDGEGTPLLVISHAFWEQRFAGDPSVIGRTVDLLRGRGERQRYTIVGVLPQAFRFTYPLETEVWGLLPWARVVPSRVLQFEMIARLNPGASVGEAQAELTIVAQDVARQWGLPDDFVRDYVTLVETVGEHAAAEARPGVLLLAGAAGVVLLIACVNVALLLVALLVDRRREMAVRAAIGARPGQLVAQVVTECALLGVLGAALGLMLAWILLPVLRALVPATLPRGDEVAMDPTVFLFAVGLAMAAALAAGLVPAWYARGRDVQGGLRVSSPATTGDRRLLMWRRAVVVAQVAVVLMLLVGAGLLLHSFWRMQRVDLGFAGRGVITMEMLLLNAKYREPGRVAEFERQVMERVRTLPGVEQASVTTAVPLRGTDYVYVVRPVGGGERRAANMRAVDPEYFSLMRIPVLAGRTFTPADDEHAPTVAVVSEAYGRSLFGDASPIGRRLEMRDEAAEIVGVVGDVRHADVKAVPFPGLYLPRAQHPTWLICLLIRPVAGAQGVAASARAVIQSIDPEQPVQHITTLDHIVRASTADERFYVMIIAGFALVAVLLAMAGVAGVVSRNVAEREREIALRIALGAEPRRVRRLAIR